jgi:hypothetical protein
MVFNECTCKDLMEQLQNETTSAKVLDKINREKIPDTQSSLLIEEIIDARKSNEDKLGKIIDENCSFEVRKFKYLQRQCDREIQHSE